MSLTKIDSAKAASQLWGLSSRPGDALDQAQQGLGIGYVSEAHFAVTGGQFQPVTVCHQLTPFLPKPFFQFVYTKERKGEKLRDYDRGRGTRGRRSAVDGLLLTVAAMRRGRR